MSCNGCRVLRKGCSDTCILRSCLQWIDSPEAQGHATVFVAKFFGRAGMISFISAVSESQRPALFQSLLYEACGRTVNPVFGAVGLLWSGNWGLCQAAVESVLKGGSLKPMALCLPPTASTKPIQPVPLKRPQAFVANPSTKRPYSMMDTNLNAYAEVKRPRSSDRPEEIPKLRTETVDQEEEPLNTISNPTFATNPDEQPKPSGKLVAPVARRVWPQAGYGLMVLREQEQEQHRVCEEHERQNYGCVELDLSLNSRANLDGLCVDFPCIPRASSPSSFSMNSEGSVTSLDTAEFSVSCVRNLSSMTPMHEGHQLLHLL